MKVQRGERSDEDEGPTGRKEQRGGRSDEERALVPKKGNVFFHSRCIPQIQKIPKTTKKRISTTLAC